MRVLDVRVDGQQARVHFVLAGVLAAHCNLHQLRPVDSVSQCLLSATEFTEATAVLLPATTDIVEASRLRRSLVVRSPDRSHR